MDELTHEHVAALERAAAAYESALRIAQVYAIAGDASELIREALHIIRREVGLLPPRHSTR